MRPTVLPMPIWDLPIRVFHWLLVLLLGFMWLSGKQGWLWYHMLSGYTILSLLLARVVWGFVGSDTARFASFLARFASLSACPTTSTNVRNR